MPLIEGLIAFALTMAALSTAASSVVGVFQRLKRSRARGLRDQVEYLYRNGVVPLLETHGLRPADATKARRQFLVDVTLIPRVASGTPRQGADDAREGLFVEGGIFANWYALSQVSDRVERADFETRVRHSRAGAKLRTRVGATRFEEVIGQLGEQYDSLGAAATERFARRSRGYTVAISTAIALGLNVNAFHLLDTYMTDPEARASAVARLAELEQDGTFAASATAGNGGADSRTSPRVSIADAARATDSASEAIATLAQAEALPDELRTQLQQLSSELGGAASMTREAASSARQAQATLAAIGAALPVGWTYYPNCSKAQGDPRCHRRNAAPMSGGPGEVARDDPMGFVQWLAGVLVTGLMMGLGAPTWVRIADSMTQLRPAFSRSKTETPAPAATAGTPPAESPPAAEAPRRRRLLA